MTKRKVIVLALLVGLSVACAKPEDTPAPARKMNTIDVVVSIPKGEPIVTFTADLTLTDAVTGELLRHPITNEPSSVKVTRSVREWRGTFTYWGEPVHSVRLRGTVTWPTGELVRVQVYDNRKEIREAGHFDETGKITIIYSTTGV